VDSPIEERTACQIFLPVLVLGEKKRVGLSWQVTRRRPNPDVEGLWFKKRGIDAQLLSGPAR